MKKVKIFIIFLLHSWEYGGNITSSYIRYFRVFIQFFPYIKRAAFRQLRSQEKESTTMKKYTTPEVEVIKFQIMKTIAEGDNLVDGSLGSGDKEEGETWD